MMMPRNSALDVKLFVNTFKKLGEKDGRYDGTNAKVSFYWRGIINSIINTYVDDLL